MHKYLKVFRISHWTKNIFTVISSFMYIFLHHPPFSIVLISKVFLAFFLSCFVSSVNYVINEILDSSFDALHPQKKYRAIPSGQIKVHKLVIAALLLFIGTFTISLIFFDNHFNLCLFTLFIAGLLYNVPPVRAKDLPFVDVISESINNPIRLFIGWYAVSPSWSLPPVSIIFFFWAFGAFLMTAKRIAEFLFLGKNSRLYRITFKYYSLTNLSAFLILYAISSFIFFIYFAYKYEYILLFSAPFYVIFLIWYTFLVYNKKNVVMNPEYIFKYPALTLYIILSSLFTLLALIMYG